MHLTNEQSETGVTSSLLLGETAQGALPLPPAPNTQGWQGCQASPMPELCALGMLTYSNTLLQGHMVTGGHLASIQPTWCFIQLNGTMVVRRLVPRSCPLGL